MAKLVTKQRKRRNKMHSTRRKQESLGLITIIGAVVMISFGVSWWIVSTVFATGVMFVTASRATPPNTATKPRRNGTRNTAPKDARVKAGVTRVGVTGREKGRRKPCTAACNYSRRPRYTCGCSCQGQMHGISAPRTVKKPTPKKRVTKKRKSSGA